MPSRTFVWPQGHWDWYQHLAFKHGVRCGDLVFVGGQVDKTSTGEPLRAGDLPGQTETVVRHIHTVLGEFGSGLQSVVSLVAFHAASPGGEAALVQDVGRCLAEIGGVAPGEGPVITPVPLPCLALPGMMVEIEAIAVVGADATPAPRECLSVPELDPLPGTLSHAVRCGDQIWAGAQDGNGGAGALERLSAALAAAGADASDLLKLNAWLPPDDTGGVWSRETAVLGAGFTEHAPVLTALPSPCLGDASTVRLSGWAARGSDGSGIEREPSLDDGTWAWPGALPFPRALRQGELVFLSGRGALDARGQMAHPGDLNAQTRAVMEHTRADLAAFGLGLDHMVKQTSFFLGEARAEDIVTNQRLRSSYYTEPAGASTGVPLPGLSLPGAMVDVETIAMV